MKSLAVLTWYMCSETQSSVIFCIATTDPDWSHQQRDGKWKSLGKLRFNCKLKSLPN